MVEGSPTNVAPRTQERLSPIAVIEAARAAVRGRAPFSAIRLGDGDGRILGHAAWTSPADLAQAWQTYFGSAPRDGAEVELVAASVRLACGSADIIGLPPSPPDLHADFGRPEAIIAASRLAGAGTRFADSSFHLDARIVLGEDFYRRLLKPGRRVGVVGCRDVAAVLARDYGVAETVWVRTPPEMNHLHLDPKMADDPARGRSHIHERYPEIWSEELPRLVLEAEVDLVLVGAGVLGKGYCHRVKALGGAALDIGSLMDLWAGLRTRGGRHFDHLRREAA